VAENLWARPATPKPGFHEKDHVEDYLHKHVCSGAMTLEEAQKVSDRLAQRLPHVRAKSDWKPRWQVVGAPRSNDYRKGTRAELESLQ
jgi:polyhydroxyalkanoate synthesis regulator phasin